ncbi:hypothetical protein NP493_299g03072 [Ridgeia piscesae]|uniref:Uncharacterized protein n=1 Tax=Ridgeia piscesae TaxID=27915 RepID=A0AAD9L5I2_RIDPI|nr:hypothetical protein NP493_299g03072 [Ridgeia piscesae]
MWKLLIGWPLHRGWHCKRVSALLVRPDNPIGAARQPYWCAPTALLVRPDSPIGVLLGVVSGLHETVQIDLKRGLVKGYSEYITFLTSPRPSSSNDCNAQAVVKVNFGGPYQVAKLQLYFVRPRLWTLDIADSPYADGHGGGNDSTSNMAEMHIFNRQMRIYGNSLPGHHDATINGGLLMQIKDNFLRKKENVMIEVSDERLDWSVAGKKEFIESKFLYTLSGQNTTHGDVERDIYVGFNRIVVGDYRTGSGLCRAVITLMTIEVVWCSTPIARALCLLRQRTAPSYTDQDFLVHRNKTPLLGKSTAVA